MCGIAGVFGGCEPDRVRAMVRALAHRGPDDRGLWSDPAIPATLGHSRLSILDLTNAGHQPMSYADERLWIVFNGEIYNYRELRAQLERSGCAFRSTSDTEVILAAYRQWGPSCVQRFRGMFAFALIDRRPPPGAPECLLARDRLGIKPLLYAQQGGRCWFASELRALLASGSRERAADPAAVLDVLTWGAVSQPRTMARGVQMLPPGAYLAFRAGQAALSTYWDLHESTAALRAEAQGWSDEDVATRTAAQLEEVTRYHLVSDVPVGAFLSGGLDSAVATALMGRLTNEPVRTFSIGFAPDAGVEDEAADAEATAAFLRTRHATWRLTASEAIDLFPLALTALDQPSGDGFNTWLVSRLARREVKVAISGLGGDELWAGYPHFADARLAGPDAAFTDIRRTLTDAVARRALRSPWRDAWAEHVRQARPVLPPEDATQRMSLYESRGYLLNTLLRDSDAMSMAHGLELRPLLLDHELVRFVYALPARHKLRGNVTKYALRRAAATWLPPALDGRPKRGFTLPYARWMSGPLRPFFARLLDSAEAGMLFNRLYLQELRLRLRIGRPPAALWGVGLLLAWLQHEQFVLTCPPPSAAVR